MAAVRDLYDILGVSRDASAEDIKRAYRKLAREHHPDVNAAPEAEERFKEVAGAYEILSDPEKRQRYDAFGTANGPGGPQFNDIQDIFDMFFGGGFGGVGLFWGGNPGYDSYESLSGHLEPHKRRGSRAANHVRSREHGDRWVLARWHTTRLPDL